MQKISKFYFKVFTKNLLFLATILGVLFFGVVTRTSINTSIGVFTGYVTFGLMCSTIGMMIISTYISGKRYEQLDYLEYDQYKRFKGMILGGIKAVNLTYLVNVIIILMNVNLENQIIFNVKGFIHFSLIWYISNILAIALGVAVGIILSGFFRYIICLMLFLPFTIGVTNFSETKKFKKLFNIFDDKLTAPENYGSDVILNRFYLLDKLFIIIFILFIFVLVYFYINKKSYKYLVLTIIAFMIVQFSVIHLSDKSMMIMHNAYIEVNSGHISQKDIGYYIKSYNMDLNLKNKLYNKCNIKLNINSPEVEEIKFLLDNSFKIEGLYLNNQLVDYTRRDNEVILHVKSFNLLKNQDIDIMVEYTGNVYVVNDLGTDIVYVSHNAVSLSSSVIDWYPNIPEHEPVYYSIHGNSSSKLYSNLPTSIKKNRLLSYEFEINGKSKGINLISGNYESYSYRDIEFIAPKNIYSDGFADYIVDDYLMSIVNEDTLTNEKEINKIRNKTYKKLIVVPRGSDDIRVLEDTIIVPY